MSDPLSGRRILLDCRWLGEGGPGRVTEHLLQGFSATPPEGSWVLWGDVPSELRWPGTELVAARNHPHRLYGQGSRPRWSGGSRPDVAVWPHQMRPLWRVARVEVSVIYDTIPLRWAPRRSVRTVSRRFLSRVGSLSDRVVTVSEHSRRCLITDLGLPSERLSVIPCAVDPTSTERLERRRRSLARPGHVLYVGRFAPHKNLERLVGAFPRSDYARAGGRLVLAGGTAEAIRRLEPAARAAPAAIDLLASRSQPELEALLASADALVQPSLEEGFGLPVAEALAAGVPVAASRAPALPEVTAGAATEFDPRDPCDMAAAIDRAVAADSPRTRPRFASPVELADRFLAVVREAVDSASRRR